MWMSSSVQTGVIGCLFNSPPSWCLIGETALMSTCVSHTEPPLIDLRPISLVGLGEGVAADRRLGVDVPVVWASGH